MTKAQHTPGPWEVSLENSGSIFGDLEADHDGDNPYIGKVQGIKPDGSSCPEAIANARLIAAAPELLNSLQKLLALYDAANRGEISMGDFNEAREQARAAIAKATGAA